MAKKKEEVVNEINNNDDCIIVEHENPNNLPDLILDVPRDAGSEEVSAWTASMRKSLGRKYNVKFRIWPIKPAEESA